MGDTISKIYDYYDDYCLLCKQMNVNAIDMRERGWMKHKNELLKKEDDEVISRKGNRYFFSEQAKGPKDDFGRPTQYHFKSQLLEKRPREIYSPNTIYGVETPYIHSIEFLDDDEVIQFTTANNETLKMPIEELRDYLEMRGFKKLFMYEK